MTKKLNGTAYGAYLREILCTAVGYKTKSFCFEWSFSSIWKYRKHKREARLQT